MNYSSRVGCAVFGCLALVGCQRNDSLPSELTGSFEQRVVAEPVGSPIEAVAAMAGALTHPRARELTLSTRGASSRSTSIMPSFGIQAGPLRVGTDEARADMFESVRCSSGACSFETKGGCEGSIEKNAQGALVVVAAGACREWSGTWTPKRI